MCMLQVVADVCPLVAQQQQTQTPRHLICAVILQERALPAPQQQAFATAH